MNQQYEEHAGTELSSSVYVVRIHKHSNTASFFATVCVSVIHLITYVLACNNLHAAANRAPVVSVCECACELLTANRSWSSAERMRHQGYAAPRRRCDGDVTCCLWSRNCTLLCIVIVRQTRSRVAKWPTVRSIRPLNGDHTANIMATETAQQIIIRYAINVA